MVSRLVALDVAGCGFEKGPGTEDRDGGLWKGEEGGGRREEDRGQVSGGEGV